MKSTLADIKHTATSLFNRAILPITTMHYMLVFHSTKFPDVGDDVNSMIEECGIWLNDSQTQTLTDQTKLRTQQAQAILTTIQTPYEAAINRFNEAICQKYAILVEIQKRIPFNLKLETFTKLKGIVALTIEAEAVLKDRIIDIVETIIAILPADHSAVKKAHVIRAKLEDPSNTNTQFKLQPLLDIRL